MATSHRHFNHQYVRGNKEVGTSEKLLLSVFVFVLFLMVFTLSGL